MTTEAPRGPGGPPPRFGGGGGRPGAGGGRPGGRPRGRFVRRRKVCAFCAEHVTHIDYKEIDKIRRFVSERAKIGAPPTHWRVRQTSTRPENGYSESPTDCISAFRGLSRVFRRGVRR
ncbi:MAG: hypothetical protein CM1200mP22_10760 [Dehalococcoidia bacterium]|nr:MAG: hypothetical protein CM1200mP22_10760 [Dehalococcoidia bacterium]